MSLHLKSEHLETCYGRVILLKSAHMYYNNYYYYYFMENGVKEDIRGASLP